MNVKAIRLINFRNYGDISLNLNKDINIFIGKNAQGKTNLLEAIYFCALGKSFRTNKDNETINFNKKEAYIGSKIKFKNRDQIVEIKLEDNKPKRIKVNKLELKNIRELDGGLNIVLFSPDNLKLVKEGPIERRNFLDSSISQIKPLYKYNINKYNRILFQRNKLLKSKKKKSDIINLLEIFNLQLAKIGAKIILYRLQFIKNMGKIAKNIHKDLTFGKEELIIQYSSSIIYKDISLIEEDLLRKLELNIDRDFKAGTTSIGPHRDDLEIKINGKNARIYGSQGQQRTIVLSIKLSEVQIIKMEKNEYPVLLLDDVYSELDYDRRKYLTKSFENIQTIITSTDIIKLDEFKNLNKSIYYIENGKIVR